MTETLLLAQGAILVGLVLVWRELRAIRRAAERALKQQAEIASILVRI